MECSRVGWGGWYLVALVILMCGCFRTVLRPFPHQLKIGLLEGEQPVQLSFYPQDQKILADVVGGMREALRNTRPWGKMSGGLQLHLFPNHRSLEEAVRRRYPWLRAWAMYDQLYIQSPRTWRYRYYQLPLLELLTHELTHIRMYQLCCTKEDWKRKQPPLWFREGMATVTARERQYNWTWRKLREHLQTAAGKSLLRSPTSHLGTDQPAVYGLSHWMFKVLVERWGVKGIRGLLKSIRKGDTFEGAFRKMTGGTVAEYKVYFLERLGKKRPRFRLFPRKPSLQRQRPKSESRTRLCTVGSP